MYVKRSNNDPLLLSLLQRKDGVYRSPCRAVPLQKSSLKVEMRKMMMAQRQTECCYCSPLSCTCVIKVLPVIFSVKQSRGDRKSICSYLDFITPFHMFLNK